MESIQNLMGSDQSTTETSQSTVPIDQLDYEFIRKCSDGKQLEKIFRVLK